MTCTRPVLSHDDDDSYLDFITIAALKGVNL